MPPNTHWILPVCHALSEFHTLQFLLLQHPCERGIISFHFTGRETEVRKLAQGHPAGK